MAGPCDSKGITGRLGKPTNPLILQAHLHIGMHLCGKGFHSFPHILTGDCGSVENRKNIEIIAMENNIFKLRNSKHFTLFYGVAGSSEW